MRVQKPLSDLERKRRLLSLTPQSCGVDVLKDTLRDSGGPRVSKEARRRPGSLGAVVERHTAGAAVRSVCSMCVHVCEYVCTCVHVCMSVLCMCVHVHTHMHTDLCAPCAYMTNCVCTRMHERACIHICMCIHVCICVYLLWASACVYTHVDECACLHVCMCVRLCACVRECVCIHICVCMQMCMCACAFHRCMHVRVHVYICVSVHACVCACVRECACIQGQTPCALAAAPLGHGGSRLLGPRRPLCRAAHS